MKPTLIIVASLLAAGLAAPVSAQPAKPVPTAPGPSAPAGPNADDAYYAIGLNLGRSLRNAGIAPDPKLELPVPFEIIAARAALDRLCAGRTRFDGVVACSDLLALQAVQAVRAAGRQVPGDVAVVGYDDMPVATYSDPPLTTVHQPVAVAGAELVDALLALLRGERAAPRMLPVHLVVRESAPAGA